MASTLTSVCVFLPAVFSASLIRSLMGPMSLCIGYCLMASLIVALTVVPAASATVLKLSLIHILEAQKNRRTGLRVEPDVLIRAGAALYGR